MFFVSFRKHCDKKKENQLFARTNTMSTAVARSVFLFALA